MPNQWLSPDYFKRYQLKKLKETLAFSFQNIPFYREISQRLKITSDDISSIEDLNCLPIVTKKLIQENPQAFYSRVGNRDRWFSSKSSGSTGETLEVFFDPHCWIKSRYALKLRSLFAMGFPPWGKIIIVRIVEPNKLQQQWKSLRLPLEEFFKRRYYLSTYQSIEDHLKFYRTFRPDVIHAPPFYLNRLAEVIQNDKNGPLHVPIVISVSELLNPMNRSFIGQCLGAEVYDIYGCSEFKDVAWECSIHNGYHINADNLVVEIVQDGTPVPVGHDGDILLTTLTNRAMPLIRYQVGDCGSLSEHICSCGRGFPMMKVIQGRSIDFIKLPDGRKISPYGAINLIEDIPELQRFQIIQQKDFSLDINVEISKHNELQEKPFVIEKIESIFRNEVNYSIVIRCNIVDQINIKPGEKCRFVCCKIKDGETSL